MNRNSFRQVRKPLWGIPPGITLIEIIIAVVVFAIGIVPVFLLLTQSRRTTMGSLDELWATTMISSMINGLKAVPTEKLIPVLDQELEDQQFPDGLSLSRLGIPPAHPHLRRKTRLKLINFPNLPQERFSNPWGKILEIFVTVTQKNEGSGVGPEKVVLKIKSFRNLGK